MMNTVDHFITDLKTETVKLQLQVSVPPSQGKQKNSILKNVFIEDFCPVTMMETIKDQIKILEQCEAVECLKKLYDTYNRSRLIIQDEGYGYGSVGRERAGRAYGYVFLIRMLRQYTN